MYAGLPLQTFFRKKRGRGRVHLFAVGVLNCSITVCTPLNGHVSMCIYPYIFFLPALTPVSSKTSLSAVWPEIHNEKIYKRALSYAAQTLKYIEGIGRFRSTIGYHSQGWIGTQ